MRILIRDDEFEDKIEIKLINYGDYTYWELIVGYNKTHYGEIYNHDPTDTLGILTKIYAATGKV